MQRDLVGQSGRVGLRFEQAVALIIVAVDPPTFGLRTRTHERLVPTTKRLAVATGDEQAVRHLRPRIGIAPFYRGRELCPRLDRFETLRMLRQRTSHEARRKAEQQMRRAVVWRDLICVHLLRRRIGIRQPDRFGPSLEVCRMRHADRTQSLEFPFTEVPDIHRIALPIRIPEDRVVRIERALGDDRPVAELRPANAVGRLEREQSFAAGRSAHGLVTLIGRASRIRVFERSKVVRLVTAAPQDVVLFRAGVVHGRRPVEQTEVRLHPMNAVAALGVTDDFRLSLPQRRRVDDVTMASVVHPIDVAVLEYGRITAGIPFPRLLKRDRDFARRRMVQPQFGSPIEPLDQCLIDEQFPPRADVNRFGGDDTDRHGYRKKDENAEHRSHVELLRNQIPLGLPT